MKLVIHAGIHRTGTSSLQDYLSGNRETLLKRGILYPGETKNHQPLAWSIKRGDAGAGDVLKLVHGGHETVHTTILSAEDFCIHEDLSWLSQVAAEVPTTVYFYLRRQDHWLMSWYNQHVKWPFDKWKSRMGADEFLGHIGDFFWIDYSQLLSRWQTALGEQPIQVSIVETGQVEDVAVDFMRHLAIDPDDLSSPAKRANDSMPVHLLEIARHLGMHAMPPDKRVKLIGTLKRVFPAPENLPRTVYSPARRRDILTHFADSNRAVARNFFQREELFLETEPADSEPYYEAPSLSHDEWMAEWVKPLIAHFLK